MGSQRRGSPFVIFGSVQGSVQFVHSDLEPPLFSLQGVLLDQSLGLGGLILIFIIEFLGVIRIPFRPRGATVSIGAGLGRNVNSRCTYSSAPITFGSVGRIPRNSFIPANELDGTESSGRLLSLDRQFAACTRDRAKTITGSL